MGAGDRGVVQAGGYYAHSGAAPNDVDVEADERSPLSGDTIVLPPSTQAIVSTIRARQNAIAQGGYFRNFVIMLFFGGLLVLSGIGQLIFTFVDGKGGAKMYDYTLRTIERTRLTWVDAAKAQCPAPAAIGRFAGIANQPGGGVARRYADFEARLVTSGTGSTATCAYIYGTGTTNQLNETNEQQFMSWSNPVLISVSSFLTGLVMVFCALMLRSSGGAVNMYQQQLAAGVSYVTILCKIMCLPLMVAALGIEEGTTELWSVVLWFAIPFSAACMEWLAACTMRGDYFRFNVLEYDSNKGNISKRVGATSIASLGPFIFSIALNALILAMLIVSFSTLWDEGGVVAAWHIVSWVFIVAPFVALWVFQIIAHFMAGSDRLMPLDHDLAVVIMITFLSLLGGWFTMAGYYQNGGLVSPPSQNPNP